MTRSTVRLPFPSLQPVYEAAALWRERSLLGDRALFADIPGSRLQDAQELVRDFVDRPDEGSGTFIDKLRDQFAATSAEGVQLAAELLFVHLLIARTSAISGQSKRELVKKVLSFRAGTHVPDEYLLRALDAGLVNPGQAFNSLRWAQFSYLIRFVAALKALPPDERVRVLSVPEAYVAFANTVELRSGFTQHNALEHLLFPDTFPPVVSREHRRAILEAWPDEAGDSGDPQSLRLARLMTKLEPNTTWADLAFTGLYRSPYAWRWSTPDKQWIVLGEWAAVFVDRIDLDEMERGYKLETQGRLTLVREALENGEPWVDLLKVAMTKDFNLVSWQSCDRFLKWAAANEQDAAAALRAIWGGGTPASIDSFLSHVPAEALPTNGERLSVASLLLGTVDPTSFPQWRAQTVDQLYRLCQFGKPEPPATPGEQYTTFLSLLDDVVEICSRTGVQLQDRLDAQGLGWALVNYSVPGDWPEHLRLGIEEWRAGKGTRPTAAIEPSPDLEPVGFDSEEVDKDLNELAHDLYLEAGFLDEAVQLLRDKGQVVFYGPPGTGKTFVARKLATHLAGAESRTVLVQFHPSYAYEDFVQGFRPQKDSSGFVLVDGPLLTLADAARKDASNTYVLVVDEINRGNIPRVFGELYFLLEYRRHKAKLLYGADEVDLPSNLLIIATMNTADRSIALFDAALRRRFYFVGFRPDTAPVKNVLCEYVRRRHPELDWLPLLVERANALLGDPALAIGPSHFMRDDLNESWIRRAWEHSVIPTIEDHFYGQPDRVAEFDLDLLRSQVTTNEIDDDAVDVS